MIKNPFFSFFLITSIIILHGCASPRPEPEPKDPNAPLIIEVGPQIEDARLFQYRNTLMELASNTSGREVQLFPLDGVPPALKDKRKRRSFNLNEPAVTVYDIGRPDFLDESMEQAEVNPETVQTKYRLVPGGPDGEYFDPDDPENYFTPDMNGDLEPIPMEAELNVETIPAYEPLSPLSSRGAPQTLHSKDVLEQADEILFGPSGTGQSGQSNTSMAGPGPGYARSHNIVPPPSPNQAGTDVDTAEPKTQRVFTAYKPLDTSQTDRQSPDTMLQPIETMHREGNYVTLSVDNVANERIAFQGDTIKLTPAQSGRIASIINQAQQYDVGEFKVEGYANSGKYPGNPQKQKSNNLKISMERAFIVTNELIKLGVPATSIRTIAWGSEEQKREMTGQGQ